VKVKNILATKGTNVITIRPEQSVREAVALLTKHNIGSLVVVNERGQPVGIISERDIIRGAARREDVFAQPVSRLMTKEIITGLPQDDLMSVAHTMTEKRFRHLPVMDQGKLIGIISIRDVVKAQRDQYKGEIDRLQTQMIEDEV
jgi:CBS domain-containing protein